MDEEGGRREGGKEDPLHFQKYLQSCKLGPKHAMLADLKRIWRNSVQFSKLPNLSKLV